MKKWVLICLIGLGIVGGVPYWTGVEVEKHFGYAHQTLLPSNQWKLTSYQFDRGWLSSNAQASFFYSLFAADDYQVQIQHQIAHGWQPLHTTTIDTQFSLAALQGAHIGQFSPLADLHTQVQLTGENSSVLTVFPCALSDNAQQLQLNWAQAQGKIYTTPTLSPLSASFELPSLMWQHAHQQLALEKLQIDSELPSGIQELLLGTIHAKLGKLKLQSDELLPSSLQQLTLLMNNQLQDQFLNSHWQLRSEQLNVGTLQFTAAQLEIGLQHWHAHSTRNLKTALLDLRDLPAVQRNLGMMGAMIQYGIPLLDHTPEIILNRLHLQHALGELNLSAQAKINKMNMQAIFNPILLLQELVAELKMRVSKALLVELLAQYFSYLHQPQSRELATTKIEQLIAQKWFIVEPETHTLRIWLSFQNNDLQVNGMSKSFNSLY